MRVQGNGGPLKNENNIEVVLCMSYKNIKIIYTTKAKRLSKSEEIRR